MPELCILLPIYGLSGTTAEESQGQGEQMRIIYACIAERMDICSISCAIAGPCSVMFKLCSVCLPTQLEILRVCSAARQPAAPSGIFGPYLCRAGQPSRSFLHLLGLAPAYNLPVTPVWQEMILRCPMCEYRARGQCCETGMY